MWNHTCPEHVQLGGRVSSSEYRIFMLFRWWQRILASVTSACQLVTRTVWKWSGCRWAMGALVLFLLYTAFLAPQSRMTFRPQLPRDEPLRLPGPPEQIAGCVDLPDGNIHGCSNWYIRFRASNRPPWRTQIVSSSPGA